MWQNLYYQQDGPNFQPQYQPAPYQNQYQSSYQHYYPVNIYPTLQNTLEAKRREIKGVRQVENELFFVYWDRFNKLCESCPDHQFSEYLLLKLFYDGLLHMDRYLIDIASGGDFTDNTLTGARLLISDIAAKSKQFNSNAEVKSRSLKELILRTREEEYQDLRRKNMEIEYLFKLEYSAKQMHETPLEEEEMQQLPLQIEEEEMQQHSLQIEEELSCFPIMKLEENVNEVAAKEDEPLQQNSEEDSEKDGDGEYSKKEEEFDQEMRNEEAEFQQEEGELELQNDEVVKMEDELQWKKLEAAATDNFEMKIIKLQQQPMGVQEKKEKAENLTQQMNHENAADLKKKDLDKYMLWKVFQLPLKVHKLNFLWLKSFFYKHQKWKEA